MARRSARSPLPTSCPDRTRASVRRPRASEAGEAARRRESRPGDREERALLDQRREIEDLQGELGQLLDPVLGHPDVAVTVVADAAGILRDVLLAPASVPARADLQQVRLHVL